MTEQSQIVYLIQPRLGGFANDLLIQTEDKRILHHVKALLVLRLGRSYVVYDEAMSQVLTTKQDHTVLFPRHTVFENDNPVAKVGQIGIIPQNYFVEIGSAPRLVMRIPLYGGIFNLQGPQGVAAEIGQHRSTWVVVIGQGYNPTLILACLAVIYREYSVGG